jgi:hypothetical protein
MTHMKSGPGYISVAAAPQRPHIFSRIRAGSGEWAQLVDRLCNQLPDLFAHHKTDDSPVELDEFVATALAYITTPSSQLSSSSSSSSGCAISDFFSTYEKDLQDRMTVEHREMVAQLFAEIHSTDIYRVLSASSGSSSEAAACCRVSSSSSINDDAAKHNSSRTATIPAELATLILFLLLRQLDETKHHQLSQQQPPTAVSSSSPPSCSSCVSAKPAHECEGAGAEVRFGESVAAARRQLDTLPLVTGEVGYLWASFRNIAFFCACRDRRTPCH